MFSGKTDELLRLLRRAEIARRRILLVRPVIDDRTELEVVRSRSGAAFQSKAVADPSEI
jgi:thymidine kinase